MADNPTTLVCRLSRNPGSLTPQGHVGLFRGYFAFTFTTLLFEIGSVMPVACFIFSPVDMKYIETSLNSFYDTLDVCCKCC
jgi:hypothetical protein